VPFLLSVVVKRRGHRVPPPQLRQSASGRDHTGRFLRLFLRDISFRLADCQDDLPEGAKGPDSQGPRITPDIPVARGVSLLDSEMLRPIRLWISASVVECPGGHFAVNPYQGPLGDISMEAAGIGLTGPKGGA